MSEPFLGEVKLFSFNYPPRGWAACDGATLQINQNQALFALLGTTYGGDGRVNFRLPDLRGRVIMGVSNDHIQGEVGGEEFHTLSSAEMPMHIHQAMASNDQASDNTPQPTLMLSTSSGGFAWGPFNPSTAKPMANEMITTVGGGTGHENRSPYLAMNYCVALVGIFPSRN